MRVTPIVSCLIGAAMIAAAGPAFVVTARASDDVYPLNIQEGLAEAGDIELDSDIHFYFGDAPHPAVVRRFGNFVTNQKTNAFGKSDLRACSWVFKSALKELQHRARSLGANAVINIHSYYKKEDVSSQTEIQCHKGFLIAGIALKADFVDVGKR